MPRDLHLEPGDTVSLELESAHLLQAAWLAYGLPLLGTVLAVGLASALADMDNELHTELLIIVCGLSGLVAGLIAGRRILRKEECLQNMTPVAASRVRAAPAAMNRI